MSGLYVAGHASLFGVSDLAGDCVQAGAFAASLATLPAGGLAMLMQHDPGRRIGRWTRLEEDPVGLWVEGLVETDTPQGLTAASLVQAGSLDGLSIGFRTLQATDLPRGGRRLERLELCEVSLVAFPMLPRARLRIAASPSSLLAA